MSELPTIPADAWKHHRPGVPFVAAIVEEVIRAPDLDDKATWYSEPPAWLVALRDARCDWRSDHLTPDAFRDCPNPDCVDGRLLHDVRVETDRIRCSACGLLRLPWDSDCKCAWNSDGAPPLGYRTVRCLVDVMRVIDVPDIGYPANKPERFLYVSKGGSLRLVDSIAKTDTFIGDAAHVDALAAACGKPPADWVGMYAVILEVHDA